MFVFETQVRVSVGRNMQGNEQKGFDPNMLYVLLGAMYIDGQFKLLVVDDNHIIRHLDYNTVKVEDERFFAQTRSGRGIPTNDLIGGAGISVNSDPVDIAKAAGAFTASINTGELDTIGTVETPSKRSTK